ncbi:MAG: 30S ribosomal protein S8 [Dehalococcoidia bacterium]
MMTDPISDMLARIRNAGTARQTETWCPHSKLKASIARLLHDEGFLGEIREETRDGHRSLVMGIRYDDSGKAMIDGLRRVSKPSRRIYVRSDDIPKVRNGLGIGVISTSKGILTDRRARDESVGGELLCEVW